MKIYTRTGDSGQTSLVGGRRIQKSAPRLDAYGTVDELNSHLGLLLSIAGQQSTLTDSDRHTLVGIQNRLFDLGAYLATDPADLPDGAATPPRGLAASDSTALERAIDLLDSELPPLQTFILPGGTAEAAQANVCRTVCRRAERHIVALEGIHPTASTFVNRLSDYLFALGRALNARANVADTPWEPASRCQN